MTPLSFTEARQRHGSQRAVAKRMGIGFRTLQRIEAGSYGDPIPDKYAHMILGFGTIAQEAVA